MFFSTFAYGSLRALFKADSIPLNCLKETHVLLLTGISMPRQMEKDLKPHVRQMECCFFPDHHYFSTAEMERVERTFDQLPHPKLIVTTEKDATRLQSRTDLPEAIRDHLYTLPIEVQIKRNETSKFNEKLIHYVQDNSRHRQLA